MRFRRYVLSKCGRMPSGHYSDSTVIDDDHAKQPANIHTQEMTMSDDINKTAPVYNEEQLTKVLSDISPDKPITLAEAIAYQYIDLENPKLGLSNDTIQRIKSLFRPLTLDDESTLNLIRIKRAGQYLTDLNVAETNSFEKFHFSEPFIYQLQQSFEPTLDFNEKQFRSLTEAILNNKDEYSKLQFDIGRTLIPAEDMKESSTNDFSQSDSGYSMTTATYESLANKAKPEFETISEPSEFDKTLGQSSSSHDIKAEIDQKTIDEIEKRRESIQKTSETIVKKEERPSTPVYIKKRKSAGIFSCFGNKKAKASTEQHGQSTVTPPAAIVITGTHPLETNAEPEKPLIDYAILPDGKRIYIDSYRERPGLDMSYKPDDFENRFFLPVGKPASEYELPILPDERELQSTTTTTTVVEEQHKVHLEPRSPVIEPVDVQAEEVVKDKHKVHLEPRGGTMEPVDPQADIVEEKPKVHLEPRSPVIEPVDVQAEEVVEEKHKIHLEPRGGKMEPVDAQADIVEEKPKVHLEPRPATIERVDVQPEPTPIVISATKKDEAVVSKTTLNLHGAPVDLPEVPLVEPGPLPTLPKLKEKQKQKPTKPKEVIVTEKTPKVKKSTGGLCASCFGAKAAAKHKKETASEPVKAPVEQKQVVEEIKKDEVPVTTIETTATVESLPPSVLPVTTDDTTTVLTNTHVDTVQEQTVQQNAEDLEKPDDRLGATLEKLVVTEEPHYQLPSGEPVPPAPIENEYSLPDLSTYDVPRSIETPSVENIQIHTEEKTVTHEIITSTQPIDIQKTSDDLILTEQKDQSSVTTKPEPMPNVEVKESSTKGSYTLPTEKTKTKKVKEPKVKEPKVKEPKVKESKVKESKVKEPKEKSEKKPSLFSSLFRQSDRKSKAPGLDLPPVERDLSPNNKLREPHRHDSDPLRIPNTDLPKPDIALPTYDKPEVDMTSGQTKQSSEFSVPAVDLPDIPNLSLPENNKQPIDSNVDLMKIPSVQLPEILFQSDEEEHIHLHEKHIKTEKKHKPEVPLVTNIKQEKQIEHLPTIETGLALSTPVDDMLAIQTDHKNFPIETDYAIKTESIIPDLPKLSPDENELPIKPELLSTEQKYTIADTQFVQPPELPLTIEKQATESPPKLPDFTFQLPSEEPISVLTKETVTPPPSFDDDVPTATSKLVPAIEISTPPIKTVEKEVIQPKTDVKKKSSTLALCSCFGTKSNAPKDQTKTLTIPKEKSKPIAAPKADLPDIELPVPSSNISSTLKPKAALRAPGNDLPPVDLTLPQSEPVRLPAVHTQEKKRKAPKKPVVSKEKAAPTPTPVSPEAVVPTATTTTVQEVDNQQTNVVPTVEVKTEEVPLVHSSPVVEKQPEEEIQIRSPTPTLPVIEKQSEETIHVRPPTPPPVVEAPPPVEEIKVESSTSTTLTEKQPLEKTKESHIESKKHSSFEIKAPALHIPELDLSGPVKSDGYKSVPKHEDSTLTTATTTTQSRSDSGLEAIVSSHLHPSSTFGTNQTTEDINQHPSISSGLGSEITDKSTTKGSILTDIQQEKRTTTEIKRENSLLRHDFTRKITMNDDLRAKLIYRQDELKKCLEEEISKSIEDFDPKKDQKSLNKILTHGIDLIKDKKVTTYPELKQKLIIDHKNDALIVDPVVRSLYCTIEKQGLDNLDKPEFPLAIRDMVRLPAKQTFDTVTHLNKTTTEEPPRITHDQSIVASCLTCGRSKSKPKVPSTPPVPSTTQTGLLDERRRVQLNTHRNELGNILRDHIQSSQPPIRQFGEHPREVEKILRKSLTLVTQPKILSYEQIRNDLKSEYKQTFYLVDPIIDIIRDTFDHCDITQMNEKTNLDILDSNISQTAHLYNHVNNQTNLLTNEELNSLKSNNLTWLNQYLIDNESKEKKSARKQNKELHKILNRTLEILSLNLTSTWDEVNSQLKREFSKAHNLCDRAIELIKQSQKDGLLLLQQSPNTVQQDVTTINIINSNGKRRSSGLITDRAKQNLKTNKKKIVSSITTLLSEYNKPLYTENQIENYVNKTFHHLEGNKSGQFKDYNDLKEKLKKDFKHNHDKLIEQIVDVIEQAHATSQFDDIEKSEVQTLMKDRLDGKPLVIKEMYVSLPPRAGAYGSSKHGNDESSRYLSTSINGDRTLNSSTSSHRIGRGLSWREANERARILFYRGKHPAIHYDEQAAGFDVRMLLETTTGGTQEIPVTDSDVHELLNSCGVQWDGVNIISLVDHSEDVVRAAEQAALKVIREKGLVDLRTPPSTRNTDDNDEPLSST